MNHHRSEDEWASRLRHPATRAMFRQWEHEFREAEKFDVHVAEAMLIANPNPNRRD